MEWKTTERKEKKSKHTHTCSYIYTQRQREKMSSDESKLMCHIKLLTKIYVSEESTRDEQNEINFHSIYVEVRLNTLAPKKNMNLFSLGKEIFSLFHDD